MLNLDTKTGLNVYIITISEIRKIPSQGFSELYTRERIAAWTVQKHSTILNAENTIESIFPKSILLDALLLQLPGIRRMFGRVSINIHQGFFLFKDCNEWNSCMQDLLLSFRFMK
jgi:hypothetical protein